MLCASNPSSNELVASSQLWVDLYEPQSEVAIPFQCELIKLIQHQAELAVHVRKVENVRAWFDEAFNGGPTGKLKRYRVRASLMLQRIGIKIAHTETSSSDRTGRDSQILNNKGSK